MMPEFDNIVQRGYLAAKDRDFNDIRKESFAIKFGGSVLPTPVSRPIYSCLIQRILSNFLAHWTNRVIALKVQELEVSQRNEAVILM